MTSNTLLHRVPSAALVIALLAAAGMKKGGRNGMLMSLAGGALAAVAYMKLKPAAGARGAFGSNHGEWTVPEDRLRDDAKAFGRTARRGQLEDRAVITAARSDQNHEERQTHGALVYRGRCARRRSAR